MTEAERKRDGSVSSLRALMWSRNLQNFLRRCNTKTYEWGIQRNSNSLSKDCESSCLPLRQQVRGKTQIATTRVLIQFTVSISKTRDRQLPTRRPHSALAWFLPGPPFYTLSYIWLTVRQIFEIKILVRSTADFYKKYILPSEKYKKKTSWIMWNWCYRYLEVHVLMNNIFFQIKYSKSHLRTELCDDHLNDVLLQSSTNMSPDVEKVYLN